MQRDELSTQDIQTDSNKARRRLWVIGIICVCGIAADVWFGYHNLRWQNLLSLFVFVFVLVSQIFHFLIDAWYRRTAPRPGRF